MKKLLNSPFFNVMMFSLTWALSIFFTKLAFNSGVQPFGFLVQTYVIALVCIAIYVFLTNPKELKKLTPKIIFILFIAGAIHAGLGGFLSNVGLALSTAVNYGFIAKFTIITTPLLAWILLKEKLTWTFGVTAAIMLVGSYLISTNGALIVPKIGDIITIGACVCWTTGNVLSRKILKHHPVSGDVVSLIRPIAAIPALLFFFLIRNIFSFNISHQFDTDLFQFNSPVLILIGGASTAIVWIFLNRTLKLVRASYLSLMSNLTSVAVAILAVIFLSESISLIQIIGGCLIILASLTSQFLKFDKE